MRNSFGMIVALFAGVMASWVEAAPLVEGYLIRGELDEGSAAMQQRIEEMPGDDEARFGLGVVEFFHAFEHLGQGLYKHGLRTEDSLRGMSREFKGVLPQNRSPEKISYHDFRQLIMTFVSEIREAELTLSAIRDPNVQLPLHVGLIKVDLTGLGKPVDAAFLLSQNASAQKEAVEQFVIHFDRGDVDWLAGYCNFLCAWGEVVLAVDGQEAFECSAHLFFHDVDTPHQFLLVGNRNLESVQNFNRPLFTDIIAFFHLWRFPVKEPERMKTALAHLEDMQKHAKSMWAHYLVETDDNREWIPNPKQTGVMQVKVTQKMVDDWLVIVDEFGLILKGEKLVPFWRGEPGTQGVNFRKIFVEPRNVDPFLWWQGTAATPYLEQGQITDLARPDIFARMNSTFGGVNFFRMAFWFN